MSEVKTDYSTSKDGGTLEVTVTSSFGTMETTIAASSGAITTILASETDYNPPLESNKGFPFSVGKNWTAVSNETLTSNDNINGKNVNMNSSKISTYDYVVLRTENTKIPAGEFQTYVIRMTKDDGTGSEIYYSPEAHVQVKEFDYGPQGNTGFSLELLNYRVAGSQSSFPLVTAVIVAAASLVVVGMVVALAARQRRTKISVDTAD
jgi:hypothetical protein